MCSSLDLINPASSDNELLSSVAHGYFGLYIYANEFWVEHFLLYVAENRGLSQDTSDDLGDQILRLIGGHASLIGNLPTSACPYASSQGYHQDPRLTWLSTAPGVRDLIHSILVFREDLRVEQQEAVDGKNPTIFCHFVNAFTRLLMGDNRCQPIGTRSDAV